MKTSASNADDIIKQNNLPTLNWKRISKAINQHMREKGECPQTAVLKLLENVVKLCGSYSTGRKRLIAIAKSLIDSQCEIVCPICLEVNDISSPQNVPRLVEKHVTFLKNIFVYTGTCPVRFLIPTHEYNSMSDNALQIVQTIKHYAQNKELGTAQALNAIFPDIENREVEWIRILNERNATDGHLRYLIHARTSSRHYQRRNPGISEYATASLTVRTSAQYLAFGEAIKERNWLICNHTTPNLAWYNRVGVAYLHNPVYLY